MRILKYQLNENDEQVFKVPSRHVVLSVQNQYNNPVLYVAVDESHPEVKLKIKCILTGENSPYEYNYQIEEKYIGTVMVNDGACVLHYFK